MRVDNSWNLQIVTEILSLTLKIKEWVCWQLTKTANQDCQLQQFSSSLDLALSDELNILNRIKIFVD